jgi:hypothetical protein
MSYVEPRGQYSDQPQTSIDTKASGGEARNG